MNKNEKKRVINYMEKIKQMFQELVQECAKEKIDLVVAWSIENEISGAVIGDPIAACRSILHLEKQMKGVGLPVDEIKKDIEKLADSDSCPCPNCTARRASKQEREGDTADREEVFSMLAKMLKGDNND